MIDVLDWPGHTLLIYWVGHSEAIVQASCASYRSVARSFLLMKLKVKPAVKYSANCFVGKAICCVGKVDSCVGKANCYVGKVDCYVGKANCYVEKQIPT